MSRSLLSTLLLALLVAMTGCGKKEEQKPPEKIVNITTAQVTARDLPLTESAVGSETWVSQAETYDPTRDLARRFYIRLPFPLDIVRRPKDTKGFQVLPHRWIVERTFGWLGRYRRLARDYEHTVVSSEAMTYLASIRRTLKLATNDL